MRPNTTARERKRAKRSNAPEGEPAATGAGATPRSAIATGLGRLGVGARALLAPVTLDLVGSLLGVVALALWLPLLHGALSGEIKGGRRFRLIASILPDRLLRDENPLVTLAAFAALMLLATVAGSLCSLLADRAADRIAADAERRLGERLLRGHLRLGQAYFDRIRPALVARNLQKLPSKAARLVGWVRCGAASSIELLLLLGLMAWLSPQLALGAVVVLPIYGLLARHMTERAQRQLDEAEELEEAAIASTQELVTNLLLVRLHGTEESTVAEYRERATARLVAATRSAFRAATSDEVRRAFNVVLLLGFVMLAAWAAVASQSATAARTLAFFFVFRRAMSSFSTLQKLPARWLVIRDHLDALERLIALEESEQVPAGELPWPGLGRGIVVRGLTFAYAGGEPVLRDVALEIPRGRLTAVVGANGSGKSTLLKLLLRLYDCAPSSIFVDSVDLREIDLTALRARTAWADVTPPLFRDTLHANLVYGLDAVDPRSVRDALEDSGLDVVVDAIPEGLERAVGPGERSLSAGEQQRVGIARALLRDAELVLLDEALASLDAGAERQVLANLVRLAADRCVVVVTHRPEALPSGTWIITLDGGRAVSQGVSEPQRPRPIRTEIAPDHAGEDAAERAAG